MSILVIGKCRTLKEPHNAGGVIVLFEQLIKSFSKAKVAFEILDLNNRNYRFSKLSVVYIFLKIIIRTRKHNLVFFNGTAREYKYYTFFVTMISKFYNKNIVLRKFAGNFDEYYLKDCNFLSKKLILSALRKANINYFETQYLVQFFRQYSENCRQFPNTRQSYYSNNLPTGPFKKRFVFISHIKEEKGINEILEAITLLPEEYQIHIYGPIIDSYTPPEKFSEVFISAYKGKLNHNEVQRVLITYSTLLLPTYHKGEGYPGIIIEALSLGIPIIATPSRGIKEMIEDGVSGFFVKEKDPINLRDTILKVNEKNFLMLRKNALNTFSKFDQDIVMKRILSEIKSLY
ncbi:glycosyltransferase family 4 protein [Gaetbulibacter aestuarii]|uniref:Glycosyltransferase family 4 protein n=1 Tax=Gaetbulibacter aestuarii TaxID=1502358 RepID=A0ABW7MUR8_9FLAO